MLRRSAGLWIALALTAVTVSAWADGVPVHSASREQLRAAQKTFLAGDELFDAGRYDEAISAYRASHEIVASPNSSLQIARSFREVGRIEKAYRAFEKTVSIGRDAVARDKEKYTPTLKVAEKEFAELKAKVALLSIELEEPPRGTELSVGERRLQPKDLANPLVLEPGAYEVVVNAPGQRTKSQRIELAAGSERSIGFNLRPEEAPAPARPKTQKTQPAPEPPPEGGSALRPYAYIAGGVGVVGVAAFAVFGLMHNSKFNDLDDSCPQGRCTPDRQSDIDDGKRYQTFANIGLAVGIVGLAAGTTLFVLSGDGSESVATAKVRVGPGSVQVAGRF